MNKKTQGEGAKSIRQNSLGWMFKSIGTRLDNQMIEALKPHSLNLGQFAILMTLLEEDGITQAEIGTRIKMPGYATTRNIDVLEENGLLVREKNESSRRSFSICLTEKGKDLAPTLFSTVKSINGKMESKLSEKEEQQLKEILLKILTSDI